MAKHSKQLAILPLQLPPGDKLDIETVHGGEGLARIGDLLGCHLAKQVQPFLATIGVHGADLAERTHYRAAPQLAAHAVARENQLALVEQLPGDEAEKIGRQTV
jgi:hypothetical protein